MMWVKDCPSILVSCPEDTTNISELWMHREYYPMRKTISRVDSRKVEMNQNLIRCAQRFTDLDQDLRKLDEDTKILRLPTDGSTSSRVEELKTKLEQRNHPLFEVTFMQNEVKEIPNAKHLVKIPTRETWKSRDVCLNFAQLSFERPALKCIELEPARRRTLSA